MTSDQPIPPKKPPPPRRTFIDMLNEMMVFCGRMQTDDEEKAPIVGFDDAAQRLRWLLATQYPGQASGAGRAKGGAARRDVGWCRGLPQRRGREGLS